MQEWGRAGFILLSFKIAADYQWAAQRGTGAAGWALWAEQQRSSWTAPTQAGNLSCEHPLLPPPYLGCSNKTLGNKSSSWSCVPAPFWAGQRDRRWLQGWSQPCPAQDDPDVLLALQGGLWEFPALHFPSSGHSQSSGELQRTECDTFGGTIPFLKPQLSLLPHLCPRS